MATLKLGNKVVATQTGTNNPVINSATTFAGTLKDPTLTGTITGGTFSGTVSNTCQVQDGAVLTHMHGYEPSSTTTVTFTLDGVSSYVCFVFGRLNGGSAYPKVRTFSINSATGNITQDSDAWTPDVVGTTPGYNTSTKVLTLTKASNTEYVYIHIYRGVVQHGSGAWCDANLNGGTGSP